MKVERNQDAARDIAYLLRALGSLGVLNLRTCDEIDKLTNHLVLVYKVVETL